MKKINIILETRVGDAAPITAPGCELSLAPVPRRGLGGRRRKLGGLLSGRLPGGWRRGDLGGPRQRLGGLRGLAGGGAGALAAFRAVCRALETGGLRAAL